MLYDKNQMPELTDELFRSPTCEYRGTPFWAWNGRLEKETLLEQIDMLKTMGMGGFHMHVRTGMDSPYLDQAFMDSVRLCVEKARKEKMLAWLYDEDRWPSGTAGGRVTDGKPENARKTLMLTRTPYAPDRPHRAKGPQPGRGQLTMRQDNGELLAVYDVQLHADGTLRSAHRIAEGEQAEGSKWYAYMETAADDPWFNNHAYVDTLNPEAIAEFIRQTHERYAAAFEQDMGGIIPAIFTDEPQFTPKQTLRHAREENDVFLPWTPDLPQAYEESYSESLLDVIPELVWELPDGRLSRRRWRFHDLIADRFAQAYCHQIGQWCEKHQLMLSGHIYGEETLDSQAQAVGEAMRCYPDFGLPGVDILCDFHQYNALKQAQSIVRQMRKPGMLSELYGVTGWDYDFRGYKLQGDWQAALGVTVRVPHLTWMTMKGEAKRDYPACIGYQSPWWDQYAQVENHFARLNTALTRGRARVRVAVVHPVESFWLYWGPEDQTAAIRRRMDEQFASLTETLLFGLIDFDFLSESQLPGQCPQGGNPLRVGEMLYDAVVVCGSRTLRRSTVERLRAFQQEGGRLIFAGDCPDHVDAMPSAEVREIYDRAICVEAESSAVLQALEPLRELDICDAAGHRTESLLCQLRQDGDVRWLFIANGKKPVSPDADPAPELRFTLRGEYRLTEYDSLSGDIRPLAAEYQNGHTIFKRIWHMHDSLLLRLENGRGEEAKPQETQPSLAPSLLLHPVEITLDEPNMLLLDMAEWALDGGAFHPCEELLRLDNQARMELGIPLRRKEVVQPYLIAPEKTEHTLTLRFRIPSEVKVEKPMLALEEPETAKVWLNGREVAALPEGWYVDHAIQTVPLPPIHPGENLLEVQLPIGRRTHLECLYLLGDFGVRVCGVEKTVVAPVRRLGFGSVVHQGLPFYTGNVNYHFDVNVQAGLSIRVPHYRGGLVKVFADGEEAGNIIFSPYALHLPELAPGRHRITLKLYGNRQNGFGQLHHTQGVYFYQSPNSWRSAGDLWSYEYQFRPMGILKSPELFLGEEGRAASHMTDQS